MSLIELKPAIEPHKVTAEVVAHLFKILDIRPTGNIPSDISAINQTHEDIYKKYQEAVGNREDGFYIAGGHHSLNDTLDLLLLAHDVMEALPWVIQKRPDIFLEGARLRVAQMENDQRDPVDQRNPVVVPFRQGDGAKTGFADEQTKAPEIPVGRDKQGRNNEGTSKMTMREHVADAAKWIVEWNAGKNPKWAQNTALRRAEYWGRRAKAADRKALKTEDGSLEKAKARRKQAQAEIEMHKFNQERYRHSIEIARELGQTDHMQELEQKAQQAEAKRIEAENLYGRWNAEVHRRETLHKSAAASPTPPPQPQNAQQQPQPTPRQAQPRQNRGEPIMTGDSGAPIYHGPVYHGPVHNYGPQTQPPGQGSSGQPGSGKRSRPSKPGFFSRPVWAALIGAGIVAASVAGWTYESYKEGLSAALHAAWNKAAAMFEPVLTPSLIFAKPKNVKLNKPITVYLSVDGSKKITVTDKVPVVGQVPIMYGNEKKWYCAVQVEINDEIRTGAIGENDLKAAIDPGKAKICRMAGPGRGLRLEPGENEVPGEDIRSRLMSPTKLKSPKPV